MPRCHSSPVPVAPAVLALAACLVAVPASAQRFTEVDHVDLATIDPATNNGRLGRTVALAAGGRVLLAAAPLKDDPLVSGTQEGAVYSFLVAANGTLQFSQELAPPERFQYGNSLAADGSWAAIGEVGPEVHVMRYGAGGWTRTQLLTLADVVEPPGVDVRGISSWAAMEGDLLALGNTSANVTVGGTTHGSAGAVVLFRRGAADLWQFEAVLVSPTPVASASFGTVVAVSGDRVLVGAQNDKLGDATVGGAYLFERSGATWSHVATLRNHEAEPNRRFGWSVALDGDVAVVGCATCFEFPAPEDPSNTGSFFAYERDLGGSGNWGLRAEVVGSTPAFIDNFSKSLRLRNGVLLVGESGAQEASFFVLGGDGWQEAELMPSGDAGNTVHGTSVDFIGGHAIVGADSWPDSSGERWGAVSSWFAPAIASCGGSFDGLFCDGFEAIASPP